jgi:hypothetical protein
LFADHPSSGSTAGSDSAQAASIPSAEPIEIYDAGLRDLRDRFDELSDRNAEELGRKVGAGLLLDGHVYTAGNSKSRRCRPLLPATGRFVHNELAHRTHERREHETIMLYQHVVEGRACSRRDEPIIANAGPNPTPSGVTNTASVKEGVELHKR